MDVAVERADRRRGAHRATHASAAREELAAAFVRPAIPIGTLWTRPAHIERIGVVVPANNEQELLPACLQALGVAADEVAVPVTVMVVLDNCTDDSAAVAAELAGAWRSGEIEVIAVTENNVGSARRVGMAAILNDAVAAGTWLATTDADSEVPPHWLAAQMNHAAAGATVVVGTVTVTDWAGHSHTVRDQAVTDYTRRTHRHVHGANLSFTATAYLKAGGFEPRTFNEDVMLVEGFTANAEAIAWAMDLAVTTSARREARAPSGFASYLSALDRAHNRPTPP